MISRHSTAVIIDDDRQLRLADGSIVAKQLGVELCMIDLPYAVRLESSAPAQQIEALAVRFVAAMSEHQNASRKVTHDPRDDGVAGLAFLKSLCHGTLLPMYRTHRQGRPFKR